ncbi:MAG: ribosome biogenesis GTP-binding protein YihA/YsxC [Gammaproteobacteria bacterium]|nr:ribosome biogenesis GTP-binding protein YihA/YsxC [Gammaproteobacteria bacterium]
MTANPYKHATFLKSAAKISQLPADNGIEVAFVGRSNAGKSSALNTLTHNKKLARTSKTPGRTQLINLFELDEARRLVDLPGYGYAKVPAAVSKQWQHLLAQYLQTRECLVGLIVLMDCRHPLSPLDQILIDLALNRSLELHILLTKSDKLGYGALSNTLIDVRQSLGEHISIQAFSALKKTGIDVLIEKLNSWYQL